MRRGNSLLIIPLLLAFMLGGFYFLLRTPAKTETGSSEKQVIKGFSKDISGIWKARFVRVNIPPGRRSDYKPSWYKDNPRDFEAEVEIGKDFHVKHLKWVEVATGDSETRAEWLASDRWKFSMIAQKGQSGEEKGQSERDGSRLNLNFQSSLGEVRECRFSFDGLPEVPKKYNLDGGFREGVTPGEVEAEIMLYAPGLGGKHFEPGKLQIKISAFGFHFEKSRFTGLDEELKKKFSFFGVLHVKFDALKKLKIASVRDIDLHKFYVKGYPVALHVELKGVNASFRYGTNSQDDSVYIEQVDGQSEAILGTDDYSQKRVKVVFSSDGSGKMLTHNGEMEFQLVR